MPATIASVTRFLVSRCPEVWLIGSRANPAMIPPKDWDIIVLGDSELLDEFRLRPPIEDLDLFIVFNGDDFESPWVRASDGAKKTGSLSGWQWQRLNKDEAIYRAVKAREDDTFNVDISMMKAIRITNT